MNDEIPSSSDSIKQVINDPLFMDRLADTYCQVFLNNDPPEIHDPERVKEQFIREMTLPGTYPYFCRYPAQGSELHGFLWGFAAPYEEHLDYITESYFSNYTPSKQDELRMGIHTIISRFARPITHINFVSEYGILRGKRGMNIFPELLSSMLRQQLPRSVTIDVSWSRKSFAMYDIVHMLDGVEVPIIPDDPQDDRVVLICDLLRINEILGDDPVRNYIQLLRSNLSKKDL
jgi:hypothetical protein